MRLTREEIRIVIFLLTALVLGAAVKHYRHVKMPEPISKAAGLSE